jgi:hypothetical protein
MSEKRPFDYKVTSIGDGERLKRYDLETDEAQEIVDRRKNEAKEALIANERGKIYSDFNELLGDLRDGIGRKKLRLWGKSFIKGYNKSTRDEYLEVGDMPGRYVDAFIHAVRDNEILIDVYHPTEEDPRRPGKKRSIFWPRITPANLSDWKIEVINF